MKLTTVTFGKKLYGALTIILLLLAAISAVSYVAIGNQAEIIQGELSEKLGANAKRLTDTAETTQQYIVIMSLIALIATPALAYAVVRHVSQRITQLKEFSDTVAKGDFRAEINFSGDDDFNRLAASLNHMRVHLGGLMGGFVNGVTHLSASSHELFDISKHMADGSVEMSERSMTVAAAAEEMSANMDSVAAASEEASTNINIMATVAEQLTATVTEIAESSENARNISEEAVSTATDASARVNELGQAAGQISKVTEVITEISEQTNLLALNATIEAARAGEAGKGFAVVANEIKELAKQTAEATQDIKSEIEGIQNTTNATVGEINQITEVINRVNDIVSTIASAVEEQSATTREIATNVAQASEGIQEVNINVSQSSAVSTEIARDITVVSQVAGDISNSSATVSANAGDLSGFTVQLRDKVGEFRLPADETAPTEAAAQSREIPDLIRWSDRIKVGVALFDDQHRQLVAMINKLHRAMKTGQAGSGIKLILAELVDYTKTHFKSEEDLMRQHGYQGLREQEEQHNALVEQVAAAQEKIVSGNAMLSMEVMEFLKEWLVNHIQGEDKKYAPFFNAKGIS